ncbi:adenosylcobinamide-phosphate synthase CbiB [Desulfonatronovibrio hydrogenovorans]|uniref:adenosylcobinamide-phosphate synthase CbiB n=1 Tax=Desulfonatronovibrio hydrogenovorans TaxID=53245 RepID=UPI00048E25BC|nr:adenosylcobinamide-phosphate synthase CbiB [Desulfonatronovibrio hydrogenovorans]
MPENLALLLLVCYLADLFLGDPDRWPHPVRLLGTFLGQAESGARNSGQNLKVCGFVVLILGSFLVYWLTSLIISIPILGLVAALYLGYASLALGCLIRETRKVQKIIISGDLPRARKSLGLLVSRDTQELDEQGLYQALAETAAENYNDAFCAPFFYLSLLGVPFVWVYKLVSTMDSMWGYKNEKWKDLGLAGARADDILAYLPARLGFLSLVGAGFILGLGKKTAFSAMVRDARRTESPNAGWTMAGTAHLLGTRMGGRASYFGLAREKPLLGPGLENYSSAKIDQLVSLILTASFLYGSAFVALAALMAGF